MSHVCIQPQIGEPVCVNVEIADNPQAWSKGLMFRKELGEDEGMLFIFPRQQQQFFWMKNTYIPLDMIFMDKDLKVVGIIENVEPMTTDLRYVDQPSKFVLEVNGGWVAKHGLAVGLKSKINSHL